MKRKNRFLQNKTFVVFSVLALCIIFAAIFAPVITGGVDPLKGSLMDALLPPCKEHIFGTDKMGRDIFTRVIYGARASLTATFGVVALIFLIGSVMGIISGYFGGIVDAVIMRIADMMLAFPGLVLALAVAGIMGASIKNAIIAIVVVSWTKYAPAPEWGYMLNEGRACMQTAPWLMIFPGLAIFVVVVVFNMLGDSVRDILDPKNE